MIVDHVKGRFEAVVQVQLERLGWAMPIAHPCQMVAIAENDLPHGWVLIATTFAKRSQP